MHYVYLLQSQTRGDKRYIGSTSDLKARLQKHNQGAVASTAEHKPWKLETYLVFGTKSQAETFERYLKSGSGRDFANTRLWPQAEIID